MVTTAEPGASPYDGRNLVRVLLGTARHGTLGTLDRTGSPFTSLVALAKTDDLTPIIITSHLSSHTGHMENDPRVSLLISSIGKGDPLAHPRLTLSGKAVAAHSSDTAYDNMRQRYLAQNPKAQLYVDLPGFWFWRIVPHRIFLNGGFGKAWNGTWEEFQTSGKPTG